ncbi:flocculation protein FLO11-like isoform X2 [Chelonus insularis]|uniref:flocculation protein FLO11-like isoform X2 n=1 Tax=Chelonus insularis TaxID=460826 RepID=UPI001589182E|nr:flocculation protein FLO11-like isoform X2 [Chelonus insularis]XP_034945166.1 flocculation protein FLO11-like isoform X2 [Chelonus insularis]
MNLALHGLLLQVILSILQFRYGVRLCSAGEPGYLDFDNLPETNFSCQGKVIGGYYADVEAGCQMFHVCTIGQKDEIMDIKFLCLNGTVFDQETRVCERVDEVDCSKSERFYNLNLELYGNNAVTLSLHEGEDSNEEPPLLIEDHQGTTSIRPSTMSTSTTTPRSSISSTTTSNDPFQHPSGYPQRFQPQPPFPSIQTSQSKSLYDDKNIGFHRQYIYHIDNQNEKTDINTNNNDNRATSYQLFSNQGVSSTTGTPHVHQVHYSSTSNPQINIGNDPSTVSPLFHTTSSTIQTLLTGNANNPNLINSIFHGNGIASTTDFTVHSNSARDTSDYQQNRHKINNNESDRRFLEPIQSTNQGKISKLTISPVPTQREVERMKQQLKSTQTVSQSQSTLQQQHRIPSGFLTIAPMNNSPPGVGSFYPTPKTLSKSQSSSTHITQHIQVPSISAVPQLKLHQVTINLPSPDIQRIIQSPSPLLPSQSRVIVTAKASVSDESGRPLNASQLVTLPTVPSSYDDYKEGDESFDPFYRDVPKIRNTRRSFSDLIHYINKFRRKRSTQNEDALVSNDENLNMEKNNDDTSFETTQVVNSTESTVDYTSQENQKEEYDEQEMNNDKFSSFEEKISASYEEKVDEKKIEASTSSQEYSNDDDYNYQDDYSDEIISEFNDFNTTDSEELIYDTESSLANNDSSTTQFSTDEISSTEPFQTSISTPSSEIKDLQIDEQTEGVLKFTDEIPKSEEEIDESRINNDDSSKLPNPLDYIDDNYEPQHYNENTNPTEKEDDGKIFVELMITDVNETTTTIVPSTSLTVIPSTTMATTMDETSLPTSTITTMTPSMTTITSTTPSTTTINTTPSTTTTSTTLSTTTTTSITPSTTTTSTVAPTTTTDITITIPSTTGSTIAPSTVTTEATSKIPFRSSITTTISPRQKTHSFNLFKTFTTRKSYVYIPPTTTPTPVIVKKRLPLLNPKPAKPPKSYNDIAPKPVIRKVPLSGRRSSLATIKNDPESMEYTTVRASDVHQPDNEVLETTSSTTNTTARSTTTSTTTTTTSTAAPEASTIKIIDNIEKHQALPSSEMVDSMVHMDDMPPKNIETIDDDTKMTERSNDEKLLNDEASIDGMSRSTVRPIKHLNEQIKVIRRGAFSCLDVELYRFYADKRDCRLFHYCSPGFTAKQVLDFRFVCEEGTTFDEKTQSCVHHNSNSECHSKIW